MRALRAVLAAVTAAAMGITLAALAHGENDPCIEFRSEELVDYPPIEYSLFPYGIECVPGDFLGPTVAATIAWMLAAGLLVAAALWRPTPVMRGALVAAAALAVFGTVYMRIGPFAPVFMFTLVATAPVAFAMARVAGVVLLPVVLFAWVFPYLLDYGDLANLVGIATGAAGAWVLDRLWRRFGHVWRPLPQ
jgi:hypothetical protein